MTEQQKSKRQRTSLSSSHRFSLVALALWGLHPQAYGMKDFDREGSNTSQKQHFQFQQQQQQQQFDLEKDEFTNHEPVASRAVVPLYPFDYFGSELAEIRLRYSILLSIVKGNYEEALDAAYWIGSFGHVIDENSMNSDIPEADDPDLIALLKECPSTNFALFAINEVKRKTNDKELRKKSLMFRAATLHSSGMKCIQCGLSDEGKENFLKAHALGYPSSSGALGYLEMQKNVSNDQKRFQKSLNYFLSAIWKGYEIIFDVTKPLVEERLLSPSGQILEVKKVPYMSLYDTVCANSLTAAFLNLGSLFLKAKRPQESLECSLHSISFGRYFKHGEELGLAYNCAGSAFALSKKIYPALDCYCQAYRKGNPVALSNTALTLRNLGCHKQALSIYDMARKELEARNEELLEDANTFSHFESAANQYRILTVLSNAAHVFAPLGFPESSLGKIDEALTMCRKLIVDFPDHPDFQNWKNFYEEMRYSRAIFLRDMGRIDEHKKELASLKINCSGAMKNKINSFEKEIAINPKIVPDNKGKSLVLVIQPSKDGSTSFIPFEDPRAHFRFFFEKFSELPKDDAFEQQQQAQKAQQGGNEDKGGKEAKEENVQQKDEGEKPKKPMGKLQVELQKKIRESLEVPVISTLPKPNLSLMEDFEKGKLFKVLKTYPVVLQPGFEKLFDEEDFHYAQEAETRHRQLLAFLKRRSQVANTRDVFHLLWGTGDPFFDKGLPQQTLIPDGNADHFNLQVLANAFSKVNLQ